MPVISLAKARKAAERDRKRRQADANAVKFGRTKAERLAEQAEAERAAATLAAHLIEPEDPK